MGVGAVVDAADGCTVHEQEGRSSQGGDDSQHHDDAEATPTAAQQQTGRNDQQGPENVELLLDGKGPEVREELRGGLREVVVSGEDGNPVGGEGCRAQQLAAQVDLDIAANDEAHGTQHENHEGDGR